jgi:hypothetical protein
MGDDDDRYEPMAPCPACFESNGFEGGWHTDWESGPYWWPDRSRPCSYCGGTGEVPAEDAEPWDEREIDFDDPGYITALESVRETA